MSSVVPEADGETAAVIRSIRRWLLVLVAQFGILLVALAAVGYEVSGATDGVLYAATGIIGALIALTAGVRALLTLFGRPQSATATEASSAE